jgi:UV DNA damage endonuclease
MRLGFAVKVLGRAGLKSNDTRRWQNNPHLSVSLAYLRDIFVYLADADIHMYRISSELAPYLTHPDMPQFHNQIAECAQELAALGAMARKQDLRLSFHPSQYIVLNAEDETIAAKSALDIVAQAQMLDEMGLGDEAVVVTHVGGMYGDRQAALERFVRRYENLPEPGRRRLVLENDESQFCIADTHWIHQRTGIRLIFDNLHFQNCNHAGMPIREGLRLALDSWPAGQAPKIHFSSPRTEFRAAARNDINGRKRAVLMPPLSTPPSDYINPFEFIRFVEDSRGMRSYDVMLEAKAKDLALLRLREDVQRFAPALAEGLQIN